MNFPRKRWRDLTAAGEWLHLARFRFLPGRTAGYHTHDFAEVFWLEDGTCVHRINGEEETLAAGDLVCIRPDDCHVLAPVDAAGFALVNLAFDRRIPGDLARRHGRAVSWWHRWRPRRPPQARLTMAQRLRLTTELDVLENSGRSRLALERFLCGLYLVLNGENLAEQRPMPPEWLLSALERVRDPEIFRRGAPALVEAAGRSAEHVARVTRALYDRTPSDLVNQARMDHAARELRATSKPILGIALDCGLGNLSHFYALFRKAHGITPRQYRARHYGQVV